MNHQYQYHRTETPGYDRLPHWSHAVGPAGHPSHTPLPPRYLALHSQHPAWLPPGDVLLEDEDLAEEPEEAPLSVARPSRALPPWRLESPLSAMTQRPHTTRERGQLKQLKIDSYDTAELLKPLRSSWAFPVRYQFYDGMADNRSVALDAWFSTIHHLLAFTRHIMRRQLDRARDVLFNGGNWTIEQLRLHSGQSAWMGANAWKNACWDALATRITHAYLRRRQRFDEAFQKALEDPIWLHYRVRASCGELDDRHSYGELVNEVLNHANWGLTYPQSRRLLIGDSLLLDRRGDLLGNYEVIAIPGINISAASWIAQVVMTPEMIGLAFYAGTNDCQLDLPKHLHPQGLPPGQEVDASLQFVVPHALPISMLRQGQLLLEQWSNLVSVRYADLPPRPDQLRKYILKPPRRNRRASGFQRKLARANDILRAIMGMHRNRPVSAMATQHVLLPVWQMYGYDRHTHTYNMHPNTKGKRRLHKCLEQHLNHD